jgi:hypothetical protein
MPSEDLQVTAAPLRVEPFLHIEADSLYNPLTDRRIESADADYAVLRALSAGERPIAALAFEHSRRLAEQGWLVPDTGRLAERFRLKYVALEAHTVCNQACYFCPVSIAPREDYFMPTDLYERIAAQLAAYRNTIEAVFMINYNEPTVDHRFLDQVRTLKYHRLPPAVLTNGSGLTPQRVNALAEMGGLRFLSVNLSTLDRERYARERGVDQLDLVLRNVDYVARRQVAEQMDLVVLGKGDDVHRRDFEEIQARYAGSCFTVKFFEVMDRAGYLPVGLHPVAPHKNLRGCENIGSRPLQHLHITPRGTCVLCCEDYSEHHEVGDLNVQTVAEVLASPAFASLRNQAYGLEEAPADFICRKCVFARTAPSV